jgi:hypothetical protein
MNVTPNTDRKLLVALIVGALFLWGLTFVVVTFFVDPQVSGVVGDSFGVVNSLFTMAAMVGAALAVYYQRDELEREKTNRIRDETDNLAAEREVRFFQLIRLLGDATDRVHVRGEGNTEKRLYLSGHRAFELAFKRLHYDVENKLIDQEAVTGCDQWITMLDAILVFTKLTPDSSQRLFFQSVVRSQLSFAQGHYAAMVAVDAASIFPELKSNLIALGLWVDPYSPSQT